MPLRESDDLYGRFRAARSVPPPRPKVTSDVKVGAVPRFPSVGMSLPPRQAIPATRVQASAPASRPRQPEIRRPLANDRPRQPRLQPADPRSIPSAVPRAEQPAKPVARKHRFRFPRGLITRGRLALLLALIIMGAGGWLGFKMVHNVQKVFHGSVFSILTTTKLRGEDSGRINVLLAGNSVDDAGHNGAELTDSIMVASLDVKNHNAYMLSIPRDMWVNIPGYGHAKINEAYVDGQNGKFSAPGYFDGGMGLLQEVVEQNFGIKADYYALVNYTALRDSVDAVGGIDIVVQSSDPRGLYDPSIDWGTHGPLVKLKNGPQHLDGREALDLARARGDTYGSYGFPRSDFDRTEHQREIILALKEKVLAAGTLSNPVKLAGLFDSIGKNIETDFTLGEVRRMYEIGQSIKSSDIKSVGLNDADGVNLLANYTSPTGQSALIPAAGLDDFTTIQAYIARLTATDPLVREAATVVVLNGTGTTGLASQTQKYLVGKGVNVLAIGDAKTTTGKTLIIDTTSNNKPASLERLKQIFGPTAVPTADNPYSGAYQADFIVVIGSDWHVPVATTQQ